MNRRSFTARGSRVRSLALFLVLVAPKTSHSQVWERSHSQYAEENAEIRRDKFDVVLPQVMKERGIDLWIHVMRESIPDSFGADALGEQALSVLNPVA